MVRLREEGNFSSVKIEAPQKSQSEGKHRHQIQGCRIYNEVEISRYGAG